MTLIIIYFQYKYIEFKPLLLLKGKNQEGVLEKLSRKWRVENEDGREREIDYGEFSLSQLGQTDS